MKFLYVSFVTDTAQYSGILKKIAGQTRGVAQLGWQADYLCLKDNAVVLVPDGASPVPRPLPRGLRWRAKQRAVTEEICRFVARGAYDAVYIKGFLATPYGLRIASRAKVVNPACRVIYEVATYPYWGEYRRYFRDDFKKRDFRSLAGHLLEAAQHCAAAPRMKRSVDALAVSRSRGCGESRPSLSTMASPWSGFGSVAGQRHFLRSRFVCSASRAPRWRTGIPG